MIDRRRVLSSMAATGVVASLPGGRAQATASGSPPMPPAGPRMNFARADRVMAELGLDALVLGDGVNFRHATGFRPVLTRMGRPPGSLAVVTRQEKGPVAAVMAEFSYYYTLADVHRAQGLPVYLFSASRWPAEEGEGGDAVPLDLFPDRGEVPLDRIETDRLRFTESEVRGQKPAASQAAALKQVLAAFDVLGGRVAVDGPAVAAVLEAAAPKAVQADADDALRRIRMVKSPVEIALMRQAAQGNVDAALEAISKARAGGSYRELRSEFFAAAARRGHRGVFMVIDRVSDESFDAELRDGAPCSSASPPHRCAA